MRLPPFLRYTLIAGTGFGLDFLVFLTLHHLLNLPVIPANIAGGTVGVTFAYLVSARHVFSYQGGWLWPKLLAYWAYQVAAILAFSWLIDALSQTLALPAGLVKIGIVPVQFLTNYVVLKKILSLFEKKPN